LSSSKSPLDQQYGEVYAILAEALRTGYRQQIELVQAVESSYSFLEEQEEDLNSEQVLSLRMLLSQAETLLGRYFGM
jgi:hypothetical protein